MLSCCHLHSLLPHDNNLNEYLCTLNPITGASGEFYFRTRRFLLAAPGSFSRSGYTSFPPIARSLEYTETPLLALSKLSSLCCCILILFKFIPCLFSNVKVFYDHYDTVRKEKTLRTVLGYVVCSFRTYKSTPD